MDNLIRYRNDRKNEGATLAELKPIDDRIATLMSEQEKPRPREKRWHVEVLPLGMATVKVVETGVACAGSRDVNVNLETETVGDLTTKACKALGIIAFGVKLVNGGKHLDANTLLRCTWIREGSHVAICSRLGCDGHCMAATICEPPYARLSAHHALTRTLLRALEPTAKWPEALAAASHSALPASAAASSVPTPPPVQSQEVPTEEDLYS
jgi:hypothetical protein